MIAMIRLLAFLLALPAAWGGLALWYQVPGGRPMKILAVALWTLLSVLLLLTLYRTRMLLVAAAFMLAFGVLLLWWQRVMPSNNRV